MRKQSECMILDPFDLIRNKRLGILDTFRSLNNICKQIQTYSPIE